MIANLITALLLALGVATGSYQSESSNAFNHEIETKHVKPQPKRQYESTILAYTDKQSQNAQRIATTNPQFISEKRYLGENINPNLYTQYCNIYNTIYDFYGMDSGYNTHVFMILCRIDNYTNSSLNNVIINTNVICRQSNTVNDTVYIRQYDNHELEPYIDQTLTTATSCISLYNTLRDISWNQQEYDNENKSPTQVSGTDYYSIQSSQTFSIPYLAAHSSINLLFASVQGGTSNDCSATTDNFLFEIVGNVEINSTNYEVVDIPNLMFTIITLPFSWYSTAFNLTIFPGTPYQLNFGNLILTIVAALILLYLIRKIIK